MPINRYNDQTSSKLFSRVKNQQWKGFQLFVDKNQALKEKKRLLAVVGSKKNILDLDTITLPINY